MNKKYQRRLSFRVAEWKRALRPESPAQREFSLQMDSPGKKTLIEESESQDIHFSDTLLAF